MFIRLCVTSNDRKRRRSKVFKASRLKSHLGGQGDEEDEEKEEEKNDQLYRNMSMKKCQELRSVNPE